MAEPLGNALTPPPEITTGSQTSTDPATDTGIDCLCVIARLKGLKADRDQIRHEFSAGGQALDIRQLILAGRSIGLKMREVSVRADRLDRLPLPAIALLADGRRLVVARLAGEQALVHDPVLQRPSQMPVADLLAACGQRLLLCTRKGELPGMLQGFGLPWFLAALKRHRWIVAETLLVSFFIQLLGLAAPLFFQVVMDKVLVHRSLSTLDVLALGLLLVILFEAVMGVLRTHVMSHTAARLDVELGASLFRHLLNLPLSYYRARRVGDTVARVRELEGIRNFLTGQALGSVLDLFFATVFVALMAWYSLKLTLVVLGSIAVYFTVGALLTPILRARLRDKSERGAEGQAFLVETVSAIETVKAMAVEPHWQRRWDEHLAGYARSSFSTSQINHQAGALIQLVNRLVMLANMYLGSKLVIDGSLSMGQLIAFNMLAGQVVQPVLRLSNLWVDLQQVGLSVRRLAEILDLPGEAQRAQGLAPRLQGDVRFDGVSFRYGADGPPVLRNVRLHFRAGEVIGIVGRSGSGKSTLTKLLQRLYAPESGRVLVDGVDLASVQVSSLRRQLGVVLQENTLFAGTIRDNIALSDPGAPLAKVIEAARLAGAHEFIATLPAGYETEVGEAGTALSGGQRQRIALARALLTQPRILILDEATSALDYESERIIQANMKHICAGRSVIIIAHRLSAVRDAHRIVVMDQGAVVEVGTHDQLLAQAGGLYHRLHTLQQQA